MSVDTLTTVTGKVSRVVTRPKVIFVGIYLPDGKKMQFTLFRERAPQHYADIMMQWQVGQEVTATGSLEINAFNNEEQLVISALPGANPSPTYVQQPETGILTQTITITKDSEDFKDQWGRVWFRVPDRF